MIYKDDKNIFNIMCFDKILFSLIIILLILSIFIIWSATNKNIILTLNKILQIIVGLLAMSLAARISPREYEILAPYVYIFCLFLLILVKIFGQKINGAQRWIDIGIFRFQPSEIVKISLPLMIARFVNRSGYPLSIKEILIILFYILLPVTLVAIQPDLGTAILITISGLFILFLSGINWKLIINTMFIFAILLPAFWNFLMYDYQKKRIKVLFNPEIDPLGSGYHVIQSKIAIGSGGLFGKGWLNGTQSQLEFLPERHTDFVFSVLSEEFGLFGIIILLILYLSIVFRGLIISVKIKNIFGRIISSSLSFMLFIYIFINISMVTGMLPIVGIPLPLVSYGGSSLVMIMISFGIIMSVYFHRKILTNNI